MLFSQCGNCHTLQWALATPRPREDWVRVIKKMAGRAAEEHQPGTYAFSQVQFIEPLADYLVSIRGPDSSGNIPFKQQPRPTDPESTNLVVTEYALPRGGERELYMLRGDKRFVWPHDVIMNDKYAYYTDHFSFVLGRIDVKTGEGTEIPFQPPKGAGRDGEGGDGRPGDPGGGAHELQFDRQGNVVIGMGKGLVKYDPKTGQFTGWSAGKNMFGLDPDGNVWFMQKNGELSKIDTNSARAEADGLPAFRRTRESTTPIPIPRAAPISISGATPRSASSIPRPSTTRNTARPRPCRVRGAARSTVTIASGPPNSMPARC